MIRLSMREKYKAFTLLELILVMGILVLLITVGISVGRYATRRAQISHHKDAARTLYTYLLKYKQDYGKYPELGGECLSCISREMFAYSLGQNGRAEQHILVPYMEDEGEFDGGANATYYYATDSYDQQFVLVCVSLGGVRDENERGFFCTGSGIGLLPEEDPIPRNDIGSSESGDPYATVVKTLDASDWKPKEGGFWLSAPN
jgi:type II secretory pathway pseudopilin PulG